MWRASSVARYPAPTAPWESKQASQFGMELLPTRCWCVVLWPPGFSFWPAHGKRVRQQMWLCHNCHSCGLEWWRPSRSTGHTHSTAGGATQEAGRLLSAPSTLSTQRRPRREQSPRQQSLPSSQKGPQWILPLYLIPGRISPWLTLSGSLTRPPFGEKTKK